MFLTGCEGRFGKKLLSKWKRQTVKVDLVVVDGRNRVKEAGQVCGRISVTDGVLCNTECPVTGMDVMTFVSGISRAAGGFGKRKQAGSLVYVV